MTGLIVGRFQPFHRGHLYLLREALKTCEKIIIAIGSSNANDESNPLSFEKRKEMIEKVIEGEGLERNAIRIVPSPDDPDDDIWLRNLLKNAGKFDVSFGNNAWTNRVLKDAGYKVVEVPYLRRNIYQGIHIRELMRKEDKWEHLVPEYLTDFVKKEIKI